MKAHSRSGQRIRITRFAFGFVSICASIASVFIAPGPRGILGAGLALLMCAIALHDARYFIIPNILSAAALALSLIHAAIDEPQMPVMAIGIAVLRGVTLGIAFLVIKLAYEWLRRRQGIGMGDIKLA